MSQAEAGFRIGIGFGALGVLSALSHHSDSYAPRYNHRVYRAERVEERAPVRARKVQPVETSVAQNENSSIAVVAPKVASVENSSITVASTDETTKVEPVKITETKKTAEAAKAIEPVKTTEIKKDETVAHNENSSITVAADKVVTVESSSITVAADPVKITETKKTADAAKVIEPVKTETKKTEPAVAQKIDCKKFFPSVGLTLTVPCE